MRHVSLLALAVALAGCDSSLSSFGVDTDPVGGTEGTPDPDTSGEGTEREPDTTDPDTTAPDPDTTDPDPDTTAPDPDTTDPDPDTTDPDPDTTDPDTDPDTTPFDTGMFAGEDLEYWVGGVIVGNNDGSEWGGFEMDLWYRVGVDDPVCEFLWDADSTLSTADGGPIPMCDTCTFAFSNSLSGGRAQSGTNEACEYLGYVQGSTVSTVWGNIGEVEANGYTYYDLPGYYVEDEGWFWFEGSSEVEDIDNGDGTTHQEWTWVVYWGLYNF